MKQHVHPAYGPVVFRDRSADTMFLTGSTITGRLPQEHQSILWSDGVTYPLVDVEISSQSHPFWTGRGRVVDAEGRVEKFNRRFGRPGRIAEAGTGAGASQVWREPSSHDLGVEE